MESEFTVTADFEAVYLINGAFAENPVFRFDCDDVLYITVMPLCAYLLPYTVKIVSGSVRNNRELAVCAKIGGDYCVKFTPRYAYMYDAGRKPELQTESAAPCRFFRLLKCGDISHARAMLSPELSSGVSDEDLAAFFEAFSSIIEHKGRYYLLDGNDEGTEYRFVMKHGLIDNIEECE